MAKLEDIKVINVDGTPIAVEELSQAVKGLVDIYNVFRNDEVDAKYELIKVQAALRDIQREIIVTIKQEQEALEAAATEVAEAEESTADVVAVDTAEVAVETNDTTEG